MVWLMRSLCFLIALAALASASAGQAQARGGEWSNYAVAVPGGRPLQVPSPDRRKTLVIEDKRLSVRDSGVIVAGGEGIDVLRSAEVQWSPDSKAFVITASDGRPSGGWDISVFLLEFDQCNYHPVADDAAARFQAQHGCGGEEWPNAGAVKWVKEGKQLLVVIETPKIPACSGKEAHRGYLVEVPSGKITAEYDPKALKEDWAEALGPRFSGRIP